MGILKLGNDTVTPYVTVETPQYIPREVVNGDLKMQAKGKNIFVFQPNM